MTPTELTLRAYGRTVAVSGPPETVAAVTDRLPVAYRQVLGGVPERRWSVTESHGGYIAQSGDEHRTIFTTPDPVQASEVLLSDLELWVAEHARRFVFVHAGCAVVNDRAVVIPGRSMSGKTSLTAALVRAGATYYSDEYAVLDPAGQVRPYPRKLAVRPYDGGPSRRTHVSELGGTAGRGPKAVGLVVALMYDAAAGWDVQPLSRGQAVLRLLDNTVPARSRPRAVLAALDGATAANLAWGGTRGDADEAAQHVIAALTQV